MAGIDERKAFVPVNVAVLTVSDSRTLETDTSGQYLADRVEELGHRLADRAIVRDEPSDLEAKFKALVADDGVDVVISTGGTGITGRDNTPEILARIFEKEIQGFGELFRMLSYETVGTSTLQSRATAGVANGTFLFALPGSTGACKDGWTGILQHQLDIRHKPCNFIELIPRLKET